MDANTTGTDAYDSEMAAPPGWGGALAVGMIHPSVLRGGQLALPDGSAMTKNDRYLLYIDILGFSDLAGRSPASVRRLNQIIDGLNVHDHDAFHTFFFSDTIIVFNKEDAYTDSEGGYLVMYSCEFVQDLLHRLVGQNVYFRAVLIRGQFQHYELENVECFHGQPLIDAYRFESRLQAHGLFMHESCLSKNKIFPTREFSAGFHFVYLTQGLEELQKLPTPTGRVAHTDAGYSIAWHVRMLKDIYVAMRKHPDPRVRGKHLAVYDMYRAQYPELLEALEGGGFRLEAICPDYAWIDERRALEEGIQNFRLDGTSYDSSDGQPPS